MTKMKAIKRKQIFCDDPKIVDKFKKIGYQNGRLEINLGPNLFDGHPIVPLGLTLLGNYSFDNKVKSTPTAKRKSILKLDHADDLELHATPCRSTRRRTSVKESNRVGNTNNNGCAEESKTSAAPKTPKKVLFSDYLDVSEDLENTYTEMSQQSRGVSERTSNEMLLSAQSDRTTKSLEAGSSRVSKRLSHKMLLLAQSNYAKAALEAESPRGSKRLSHKMLLLAQSNYAKAALEAEISPLEYEYEITKMIKKAKNSTTSFSSPKLSETMVNPNSKIYKKISKKDNSKLSKKDSLSRKINPEEDISDEVSQQNQRGFKRMSKEMLSAQTNCTKTSIEAEMPPFNYNKAEIIENSKRLAVLLTPLKLSENGEISNSSKTDSAINKVNSKLSKKETLSNQINLKEDSNFERFHQSPRVSKRVSHKRLVLAQSNYTKASLEAEISHEEDISDEVSQQRGEVSKRISNKELLSDVSNPTTISAETEGTTLKSASRASKESKLSSKDIALKGSSRTNQRNKYKRGRTHTFPASKKKDKRAATLNDVATVEHALLSPIENCFHLPNVPIDLTLTTFLTPNSYDRRRSHHTSTPAKVGKKKKSAVTHLKKSSRGSLKQKRWIFDALKERQKDYEDNLFENNSFDGLKELFKMDEDSDVSFTNIATPKCGFQLTPKPDLKTPHYKDCYSPMELLRNRKLAEEAMHRRNKKRKSISASKKSATSASNYTSPNEVDDTVLTQKRLEFEELVKNVTKKQKKLVESEDDSDTDDYFSDVST